MSERKKMKVERNVERAKERLEALSAMEKSEGAVYDAERFVSDVQESLLALGSKDTRHYAILAIAEVFKLVSSPEEALEVLLSEHDLSRLFQAVYDCIVDGKFDMSPFVQEVFFANFSDTELISKFFEVYAKSGLNRPALKQILGLFVKFDSTEREKLVEKIVNNHKTYLDLIPVIMPYIDASKLDEDLYAKIFCDCPFFRENVEFREIRGRNRLEFVQKAIETHMADVLTCYCRDRDQRIRQLLAKQVHLNNVPFLKILVNDPEDEVRLALIKRMSYADAPPQVADRALDKAASVRHEVFRIFGELVHQLRIRDCDRPEIFDRSDLPAVEDGRLMFRCEASDISTEDLQAKLVQFFSKICQGCLTCLRDEYISVIGRCRFSLSFLAEHRSTPGLSVYLKTLSVDSLDAIPMHLRGICLEYMFKGSLTESQVRECIRCNIFEVLKHIQDPIPFYGQLLETMLEISDEDHLEAIAETIKPILKTKLCVRKESKQDDIRNDTVVDVSENQNEGNFQSFSRNELFVNAHTMIDESVVERQTALLDDSVGYPGLYFMAYKCPGVLASHQLMAVGQVDISKVIRLLVYMNTPKYIEPFVDTLLSHSLDTPTKELLVAARTLTATLIYFYCTGLVRVPHRLFFITAVKCCLSATNEARVDQIFKKYMRSVPQTVFNNFFSICCILKNCVTCDSATGRPGGDTSLMLTPAIVDGLEEPAHNTIKLTKRDKMLSYICSSVIASRDGVVVDVAFEPSDHGFSRLKDSDAQLIYIGQVVYE